ncbi:MAG: MFS transporter [candidate division Zixibacteria bacterium]|nr:MFS transporter [candidate division Zixibacteria bacterium]MDD5427565.1 MFS transporter [candidate division Zixibacteria bacterium]
MLERFLNFFRQFGSNLWILAFGWFVSSLGFAASIPFISIYFHSELGLSTTEIGVFFAVIAVVRSFFQLLGGEMSDRISRRKMLINSQAIRVVTFVLLGLAIHYHWGFWAIAVFFTANSIVGAVFMPTVNALVSDILPPEKRLDGYAVSRSGGNLGWAAGPAIGGFMAAHSYAILFFLSGAITLLSVFIFWLFLKVPDSTKIQGQFRLKDLIAIKNDANLARHAFLTFFLYLVIAQLIAPMSIYTVEMVGISESQLGILFTVNGLLVVLLQIPVTRLLARFRFTTQLAWGAILHFIGYSLFGIFIGFHYFIFYMVVITLGEVILSPPTLTLTSRLAPEGRIGRYMGIHGFFVTAGWSLGPLYGGVILDHFGHTPVIAWLIISSLALLAGLGYLVFGRILPIKYNLKNI